MADYTMRDSVVASPQPAVTMQTGSPTREDQDSSHAMAKPKESQQTKETSNHLQTKKTSLEAACRESATRDLNAHAQELATEPAGREDEPDTENKHDCSQQPQDCLTSNINKKESNISTNPTSPKSADSKSEESDDSGPKAATRLRSARRSDSKRKSDSDSEDGGRRKAKTLNNNEYPARLACPFCDREFASHGVLQTHLDTAHPALELKCDACNLSFDSQRVLTLHRFMVHSVQDRQPSRQADARKKLNFDRKNLKNVPKVIGFQDIDFVDFSSEKFPLIAKNICEKSLHLSKDEFSSVCSHCGRGFPCGSALEIHAETCESKVSPKVEKKNKRKSTPKFRPPATSDSDDCLENMEVNITDQQRTAFFNSLDLRNTGERQEPKPDLADIQSIISVTNIPGIMQDKPRSEEKPPANLNIQINNSQSSPGSFSSLSLSSPSLNVLNLVSPNYSEEEAQDCFAAECRRMKLRGEFPCKLCSAVFPNLRALKGHNRIHVLAANGTPTSPYRCNICTYSSLDKATLVRHMRAHNGDRPYECAICNYAFTTKANCERHLRNRHSKMTREEVKSSIIYHPSEDPINDSEYQKTTEMNKKNLEKSREKEFTLPINLKINLTNLKEAKNEDLFQSEHQELIKNIKCEEESSKAEAGTMTEDLGSGTERYAYEENEEALDLSVKKGYESDSSDAPQDLSKKEDLKEFNNNIDETLKPEAETFAQYFDPKPNLDVNSLVKMYSNMYPSLNMAQIHQVLLTQLNFPGLLQRINFPFPPFLMSPTMFPNSFLQKDRGQKDMLGLQLSGGNILDDKKHGGMTMSEKLQFFQQQALAEIMMKREKDRLSNDFYPKAVEKQNKINDYYTESDKKIFNDILSQRNEEEKKDLVKLEKPDNRGAAVKMVIKNGVLMPKQKQRRYRTERPFSCEHCSARFTLRSNMERHIKQQHPQHWTQKSRSNVGNLRRNDLGTAKLQREYDSLSAADYLKHYDMGKTMPALARDSLHSSGGEFKLKDAVEVISLANDNEESDVEDGKEKDMGTEEEREEGDEDDMDEEEEEEVKNELVIDEEDVLEKGEVGECYSPEEGREGKDLASVSRMLDAAVSQTQAFQKYFQEGARRDDERRDEGDRSEEEEGLVAGSTSSDENRSECETSSRNSKKKKSAYSLAPNRVSCPYCFRKFPWTSSLRRHVLTHTGQKPFKCTHCPLLFTTKSNCDRHLLRKHGREALIASSGQTENVETAGSRPAGSSNGGGQNSSQGVNYTMRNVPERPFKCSQCPSSTFSTLSNLNKHLNSKHHTAEDSSPPPPQLPLKQGPPNVTVSSTFPLNIPKHLTLVPRYDGFAITVPAIRLANCNGVERDLEREEPRPVRKRSSSDEPESCERKRASPDTVKISGCDSLDQEPHRSELPLIPASELPFKCHLCEGSFGERGEALDHMRAQHPTEFQLLVSKGALEANTDEERGHHEEQDDVIDSTRGRFPDYAHRKVMCAFCMRRFWSAEDLRRHMRTHTGERPFSCDVCQRRFTLKHSMLRHRKKHNAADDLLGSDEEHVSSQMNNNNICNINNNVSGVKSEGPLREDSAHKTILHQTLTRCAEEAKPHVV